jgi:hypothetical protein
MDVLGLVLPLGWVLLQVDVLGQTLECLLQLVGELVEVRGELLLLLVLAFTPVGITQLIDKWLEDLVDDGVQRVNEVFRLPQFS